MDNYRPISILPAVSKVLERAVYHKLYSYLQWHKVLSPYECGFPKVPLHGVGHYSICLADTIRRNIDQGRFTGVGLISLRKVFDTVNHKVLLNKLRGLGVVDGEHEWFTNH